jgi:cystathionine gamma-synthase
MARLELGDTLCEPLSVSDSERASNLEPGASQKGLKPETYTAQGLGRDDPLTRAVVPGIHTSTTYLRDDDGGYRSGRGYSRADNPTYDTPEDLLAKLEGGAACLLFSSGMAAAASVFQTLLPDDHVIAPRMMYWALRKWISDFPVSWGLHVDFVDLTDLDAVRRAVRPGRTKLIWAETPANPTWDVCDIRALADIAHDCGARLAVDSTVATPVLTRPIEHGAHLVVHSATKYLNGHSDVVAGAVVGAKRDAFWHRIRAWQRDGGAVLGPFEAWLLLRGMRTLFIRVRQASKSAAQIAKHFCKDPRIHEVLYPGLPSHPGHALSCRQMSGGFGGMLSLRVAQGEAAAVKVAGHVHIFKRATSLGGVESLIEHRASIEGAASSVPSDLLRFSIGLEDPTDLINDIEQALDTAGATDVAPEFPVDSGIDLSTAFGRLQHAVTNLLVPVVRSRGGDIELESFTAGCARLVMSGSPGASAPLQPWVEQTLSLYEPNVKQVLITALPMIEAVPGNSARGTELTVKQVQNVLDRRVNGAIAAHGGRVRVVGITRARVDLSLEGRCQGCAMSELTLRQGIEPALRAAFPVLEGIVDVTDHDAGTNPYYNPGKRRVLD